jgi:RND family efflux transporter MFP subunit
MESKAKRRGGSSAALLFALGWLAPLALAACGGEEAPPPRPRPVLSMKVGDAAGIENRRWPGRAKATQEVNMAFEVSGRMIERPVDVGSEVKTGQVLARLDARDFQNALDRARAERDRAQAFYERVEEAARTGAVARQDVTDAEARFNQADATVKINQKALDDSILLAPFDGTISATYFENFQNVRAKQVVMRLLDTSELEMEIHIPESLIAMNPYVKEIRVAFDVYPGREIPARITEISNEASQTTRTYPVTLAFDPPEDLNINPGMAGEAWAGRVEVPESLRESGMEIPVGAVFTSDGEESQQSYVWLIDEDQNTVHRHPVETLRFTARGVLVQGLERDQRIATAGVHYLSEGQQVRIQ